MGPERRKTAAHMGVVEAIIVGTLVAGSLAAFMAIAPGPDPAADGPRDSLSRSARDALAVTAEMNADPPASSLLEDLVTQAVLGDSAPLRAKMASLLPVGAGFELYLENLEGGSYPLVTTGYSPRQGAITASTTIIPHWSYVVERADVGQLEGIAPPATGAPATDPLKVRAVLVRSSYVDADTSLTLTLPNGYAMPLTVDPATSLYSTASTEPEKVGTSGYDVPYRTDTNAHYVSDAGDLAQAVASYEATSNVVARTATSTLYQVHPKFTLSSTISQNLLDYATGASFAPDARDYRLGDVVTLTWNTGGAFPATTPASRTIRLYNPAGAVALTDTSTSNVLSGTYTYSVPPSSFWGTYVAELEITLKDPADATKAYLVHKLTWFNVDPSTAFAAGSQHVPPLYRVALVAWQGEWS